MKAAVISYGSIRDLQFHRNLLRDCSLIICADGGMMHAKRMDIIPHVLLGDFDSYDRELRRDSKETKRIEYPREKDKTDTQLAVEYALSKGARYILLLGAIGTRLDHTIANLNLLKLIADNDAMGEIINEHNRISLIKGKTTVRGKDSTISLIPYSGIVQGITLTGFKYPLRDFALERENTRGISNVLIDDVGSIDLKKGWLMVIKSKD